MIGYSSMDLLGTLRDLFHGQGLIVVVMLNQESGFSTFGLGKKMANANIEELITSF